MSHFIKFFLILSVVLFLATAYAEPETRIITSIKPLALVAREITAGTAIEVEYLLPPTVSEHNYALKFSDIKKLQSAQLVIWLGEDLESYMAVTEPAWHKSDKPLKSLPLIKDLNFGSLRVTEVDNQLGDTDKNQDHEHSIDPHVWLSPELSQQVAALIAIRLSVLSPQNSGILEQNLNNFRKMATNLDALTARQLEPYHESPFLVYHSAYGYFVQRYQLNQIGALNTQPGVAMSLKRLTELQKVLNKQSQSACIFLEPQFANARLPALSTVNPIQSGTLDPLGIEANNYQQMIIGLTKGFVNCFEKSEPKKKA